MKLGEMLVRDGRITEVDLRDALNKQAQDGGRVGTVMVEMGLIDLETLTVYLGLELGIPIATWATLERAKHTAVRLLTPEHALLFRCIPMLLQNRQLIAAVDDPHDMATMEQLSRITGYRVIPRVAPEIRIFYYLERYYGIPRPKRFASFGDGHPAMNPALHDLPAPPLPGLPPHSDKPVAPPETAPLTQTRPAREPIPTPIPLDYSAPEQQALKHDADELVSTLDSDDAANAEEAPRTEPNQEALNKAATLEFAVPEFYEPLDLESALAIVGTAGRRGEVAHTLMSYAVGIYDVVALCIVRNNMAFGWKACGPNLDRERIEALLIPLDAPSMFQVAIHKDGLFHAVPFPGPIHNYLYRVLRCNPPAMASVIAVTIGKRVVNLLYGHKLDGAELTDDQLAGLRRMADAASEAYVRLIAASKRAASEPADEAEEEAKRQ